MNDSQFTRELQSLINRHSAENESNTPDFILAQYLRMCLIAFNTAVNGRDNWYSIAPYPGWRGVEIPEPANLLEAPEFESAESASKTGVSVTDDFEATDEQLAKSFEEWRQSPGRLPRQHEPQTKETDERSPLQQRGYGFGMRSGDFPEPPINFLGRGG